MLFVAAWAAAGPLVERFPEQPFLSIAGRVPLALWFSRVRSLSYGEPDEGSVLDERSGFGYRELNIVALLRRRAIFVPGIYATSGLSQRLGHRYGMPKREVEMWFRVLEGRIESAASFGRGPTEVSASLLASGRILAKPFDQAAPWWTWPARFPSGESVRARILRFPRAQLARIHGVLRLDEPWLAEPARLWPLGIFVPGFVMRLPPPSSWAEG